MGFDARSLERLKQLGRSLPEPLPPPATPGPNAPPVDSSASDRRHRVETETDPDTLFRELIKVSSDGTVPPHLLDRLRQAEDEKRLRRKLESGSDRSNHRVNSSGSSDRGELNASAAPDRAGRPSQRIRQGGIRPGAKRRNSSNPQEDRLYTEFQQLLLEDDDQIASTPETPA